jgi:hypothetical protein
MHCQGHHKRNTTAIERLTRKPSKQPSQEDKPQPHWQLPCSCVPLSNWDPWHTSQEQDWFETKGENFLLDSWWKFTDGHIAIPESLAPTFVKQFHEGTHSGQTGLETILAEHFYVPKLSSVSKTICKRHILCLYARNIP